MMCQLGKATESAILFIYLAIVFALGSWDVEITFWSKNLNETVVYLRGVHYTYRKQQNCPCLRNWNAKLNYEWRIIAESREVFHLEQLSGFDSDFVYAKFSEINVIFRPSSYFHRQV